MVKRPKGKGSVIWITGLSGSGKTTLGRELVRQFNSTNRLCVFLDGDELRGALGEVINESVKFELNTRKNLAFFYGRLCLKISEQGHLVVIATVSLFNEIHEWNRANLPNYCEVVLDTPIQAVRNRNSKNVYNSTNDLEKSPVTGIDFAAEFPVAPDITFVNFPFKDPAEMASKIISLLEMKANL
jgi:adenylylsulfate kinase-like enzyme